MYIVKLFALWIIVFTFGDAQWRAIKDISLYHPQQDFNLREDVHYFEIRQYAITDSGELSKKIKDYKVLFKAYQKPLSALDQTTQRRFKATKPLVHKESNLKVCEIGGVGCHYLCNIFLIDNKNRIYKMNEIQDIVPFLGQIDTDAEFVLLAWLQEASSAKFTKYKKTDKGFEAISRYDEFEEQCGYETSHLTFNKKMKMINKKVVKSTLKECHVHPIYFPCEH